MRRRRNNLLDPILEQAPKSTARRPPAEESHGAGFDLLYVFFVMSIERRTILHFNLTRHPTAKWTAQQVVEACAFEAPTRFLIRDDARIYGADFIRRVGVVSVLEDRLPRSALRPSTPLK